MANRAIIYRLYPTSSQKLLLTKTFGCCRFVYNRVLSVQQERYKNGEKHLSRTHANNFCNRQLKPAYPFLREVDKFALNQIAARWPAKAVAQFPFSKKAVTRMSQDSIV